MNRSTLAIAAAALMLSASPLVAQTTVAGDWDVTIVSPQGPNTVRVTFKQDGEKVSGLFKSPMGELPFEGGTLTGSDLKFQFAIPIQGTPLDITMTGKVDGSSIAGKAVFGTFGEGEWTGKKVEATAEASAEPAAAPVPAAATTTAGLTGKWDVIVKTQMGDVPVTAEITDDAGTITGTLMGPAGPTPVTGTFDGSALKLSFTAQTPQGDVAVTMTGEVSGDAITGKAEFGGMGNGEWSAKRTKQ